MGDKLKAKSWCSWTLIPKLRKSWSLGQGYISFCIDHLMSIEYRDSSEVILNSKIKLKMQTWVSLTCAHTCHGSQVTVKACEPLIKTRYIHHIKSHLCFYLFSCERLCTMIILHSKNFKNVYIFAYRYVLIFI